MKFCGLLGNASRNNDRLSGIHDLHVGDYGALEEGLPPVSGLSVLDLPIIANHKTRVVSRRLDIRVLCDCDRKDTGGVVVPHVSNLHRLRRGYRCRLVVVPVSDVGEHSNNRKKHQNEDDDRDFAGG